MGLKAVRARQVIQGTQETMVRAEQVGRLEILGMMELTAQMAWAAQEEARETQETKGLLATQERLVLEATLAHGVMQETLALLVTLATEDVAVVAAVVRAACPSRLLLATAETQVPRRRVAVAVVLEAVPPPNRLAVRVA